MCGLLSGFPTCWAWPKRRSFPLHAPTVYSGFRGEVLYLRCLRARELITRSKCVCCVFVCVSIIMSDMVHEPPDFKDMDEEELWDLINDNRHAISLGVRPCMIIPYLRQARVLSDLDEDEVLTCHKLNNSSMRTSEFAF